MSSGRLDLPPSTETAAEIGNCACRLAAVLRRCPPPSQVVVENLASVRSLLGESRSVVEVLEMSHDELMSHDDLSLDERDLCEAVPALLAAHRRMITQMEAAVAAVERRAV